MCHVISSRSTVDGKLPWWSPFCGERWTITLKWLILPPWFLPTLFLTAAQFFFFQLFNNESEAAAPNWKFYKMNAIISNHGQYAYPQISRTLLLNIIRYWQYDIFTLQYSGADVHRVLAEIKGQWWLRYLVLHVYIMPIIKF